MQVFVFGAGKVGRALAAAGRRAGFDVTLRAARRGWPRRRVEADLVILAVRERTLATLCESLAADGRGKRLATRAVCVHNAGALSAEVLAPLRTVCAGVAQLHPMMSFASAKDAPDLAGGHAHVAGDAVAERRARAFARRVGLVPRTFAGLDPVLYHAAAAFVANGGAALCALGEEMLVAAGVPRAVAPAMLGPLLGSVAGNVSRLGFPTALTGPVRRGDAGAIERHARLIAARVPQALGFYREATAAQVPLGRALGEAPAEAFDAVTAALDALTIAEAPPHPPAEATRTRDLPAPKATRTPRATQRRAR